MKHSQAKAIAEDMLEIGHFHFQGVSWEFYTYLLEQRDRTGHWARYTYDRGQMEVLTGAGVMGEMKDNLTRMLEQFAFEEGMAIEDAKSQIGGIRSEDTNEIYLISWTRPERQLPERFAIEIKVVRAVLEQRVADSGAFIPSSPDIGFCGKISGRLDNGQDVPIDGVISALYPGISLAEHLMFLRQEKDLQK